MFPSALFVAALLALTSLTAAEDLLQVFERRILIGASGQPQ